MRLIFSDGTNDITGTLFEGPFIRFEIVYVERPAPRFPPELLERVRKLRAMTASPYPAEAATAQRMADALMRKHGITPADL